MVVHYRMRPVESIHSGIQERRLGLAVSKAVGGAVMRNRVKRRFRVLARRYEDRLPGECDVVMRALPACSRVSFPDLDHQVEGLFSAIGRRERQNTSLNTGEHMASLVTFCRS